MNVLASPRLPPAARARRGRRGESQLRAGGARRGQRRARRGGRASCSRGGNTRPNLGIAHQRVDRRPRACLESRWLPRSGRTRHGRQHGAPRFGELLRGRRGAAHGERRRPRRRSRRHATTGERAAAAATSPFRFSRMGPKGIGRQLGEANRKKIGRAMAAGGGGAAADPGRLHLPRPVRRPRPDASTRRTSCSARTCRPAQLLQARSPSLDLDSLYGAGPQDPESAKFYEADGLHLKMGKTVAADGVPAKDGFDLPRGAGNTAAQEAQGDHPGPAQRREPRGRPDAPRVDPLPQPRRRHAAGLGAAGAALREGARARDQALPVDAPHRLPAAHLRARRGQQRLQQRPQGLRGRRAADATCRRCRSSSRSPPSGSATR